MSSKANTRDISRIEFTSERPFDGYDNGIITLSCMLRIADATELMAKNHTKLQADCEYYKEKSHSKGLLVQSLNRTLATTKGHVTREKTKHAATKKILLAALAKINEITKRDDVGMPELERLEEVITVIKESQ